MRNFYLNPDPDSSGFLDPDAHPWIIARKKELLHVVKASPSIMNIYPVPVPNLLPHFFGGIGTMGPKIYGIGTATLDTIHTGK